MKKVVYIIPGYGESHLRQHGYKKVAKLFETRSITPIQVKIDWGSKNKNYFGDYTKQFLRKYKKQKNIETYILGFSYGAMIAFLTATKTKPKGMILCSLSPYFKEDMKNLKPSWVKWWRNNFIESDYSFEKIASKIKVKTYLIVGEKEDDACLRRTKAAKRKIQNSHLFIAKGAEHKIDQKEYLKAVEKVIIKL